jgi:hypothetical protein
VSLLLSAGLLAAWALAVSRLKDVTSVTARAGAAPAVAGGSREGLAGAAAAPPAGD